ncbi:MAG: lectin-like protein [Verrucomicrobiota bacterium]
MRSSRVWLSAFIWLALCLPCGVLAQSPPPGVPKEAKHFDGSWFLPVVVSELGVGKPTMAWTEAQDYAEKLGGTLASLETNEKRESVRAMLLPWPDISFWVGCYYAGREWRWLNGKTLRRDKPDDRSILRRIYFAQLRSGRKFNGRFDHEPLPGFVVEFTSREVAITPPPVHWSSEEYELTDAARPPGIPETAVHFEGHWYEVHSYNRGHPELEGISWKDAHDWCVAKGGHLVCLELPRERNFVLYLLKDFSEDAFWTGGYRAKSGWRWINGKELFKDGAPVGTGKETTRRVAISALGKRRVFNGDPSFQGRVNHLVIEYSPGENVSFTLPEDSSSPPSSSSSKSETSRLSNDAMSGSKFADPIELNENQARIKGLLVMDTGRGEAGSASTMSIIALPDNPSNSATLQFNQSVGSSMQTALAEVVKFSELRHDGWPRGRKMEISFENKYNLKDGPSAAVACALLLESLISGESLDIGFAVTGDMNADGSVQPIGGVEAKVRGAFNDQCQLIAIPEKNITALYDTVLMDGIAPLMRIQAFSIGHFEQAWDLARTEKPLAIQIAMNEFAAIQSVYQKDTKSFDQTIRHPKVTEKLEAILKAAPNHASAQILLAFSQGRAPATLSLHGSFSFIDENAFQIVNVIKDGKVAMLDSFDQDQVADAIALLRRNKLKLDKRTWNWADSLMQWGELMREYQTNRPKATSNLNRMIDSINAAGAETRDQRERLLADPEIMEELID